MSIRLQMIAGAILSALILIWVVNIVGNLVIAPPGAQQHAKDETPPAPPPAGQAATATPDPNAAPPADKPLGTRLAVAEPDKGQTSAKKCVSCHSFDAGGPSKVGPNLHGVVGRDIASISGFAYSQGLQGLPGNWTYEQLDAFLTKPAAVAPGTKMSFAGVTDSQERANIIAYLRQQSPNAPPPPAP